MKELSKTKHGVRVECKTCGKIKSPTGRSVPLELVSSLCDHDCPGFYKEPFSGSLWPRETEEEFGFDVGTVGTSDQ